MNESSKAVIDSVDLAESIHMRHYNLLRSIRTCSRYIRNIQGGKAVSDFWQESTHTGNHGAIYPAYQLTETGQKLLSGMPRGRRGRLALVQYVTHFVEVIYA